MSRSAWLGQLLLSLDGSNPEGRAASRYLRQQHIGVEIREQRTAARWTLGRGIQLHPRYVGGPPNAPYALSLVVHEVRHLQQGLVGALSVRGEMEAWQAQFRFLRSLKNGSPESPERAQIITELLALPLGWDRSVLQRARILMQGFAGKGYRIDLLPLYPLQRELIHRLSRRPASAMHGFF